MQELEDPIGGAWLVRKGAIDLVIEFGADLLLRSVVWMTLRESRSSFEIEGEADKTDRIQRFADVLARRTGQGEQAPLDDTSLAELQRAILGARTTVQRFGLRQSPVFVGEGVRDQEIVHYVAPPPEDLADMLAGLQTSGSDDPAGVVVDRE